MLEHLILQWGYLALFVGTLLEGESVLLACGALAHKGLLQLPLVLAIAALGGFLGDVIWYLVGRRIGWAFLQKRPSLLARTERIKPHVERFGGFFVVGMRFVYGMRTAAPLYLGATHFPFARYLIFNGLGAVLWSLVIGLVGYQLGAGVKALLDRHPHVEEILILTLVIGVIAVISHHVYRYVREKRRAG